MADEKKGGKFVSPNEMMKAGKDSMLDGREPSSKEDWVILFNFFAVNISRGLEEHACLLLGKMYDSPLTDDEIKSIAQFQHAEKIKGVT